MPLEQPTKPVSLQPPLPNLKLRRRLRAPLARDLVVKQPVFTALAESNSFFTHPATAGVAAGVTAAAQPASPLPQTPPKRKGKKEKKKLTKSRNPHNPPQ
jgi:hypothetical protein